MGNVLHWMMLRRRRRPGGRRRVMLHVLRGRRRKAGEGLLWRRQWSSQRWQRSRQWRQRRRRSKHSRNRRWWRKDRCKGVLELVGQAIDERQALCRTASHLVQLRLGGLHQRERLGEAHGHLVQHGAQLQLFFQRWGTSSRCSSGRRGGTTRVSQHGLLRRGFLSVRRAGSGRRCSG
jgi:hypothetical protein